MRSKLQEIAMQCMAMQCKTMGYIPMKMRSNIIAMQCNQRDAKQCNMRQTGGRSKDRSNYTAAGGESELDELAEGD